MNYEDKSKDEYYQAKLQENTELVATWVVALMIAIALLVFALAIKGCICTINH
jgi:hypothetical protein